MGKVIVLIVRYNKPRGSVSLPRDASPFNGGPPGKDVGRSGRGKVDRSDSPRGEAGPGPAMAAADPPRASNSRRRRAISDSYLLSVSAFAVDICDPPFSCSCVCRFELVQALSDHSKFIDLRLNCCQSLPLSRIRRGRMVRRPPLTLLLIFVPLRLPDTSILTGGVKLSFDQVEEFIQSRVGWGGNAARICRRRSSRSQSVMLL